MQAQIFLPNQVIKSLYSSFCQMGICVCAQTKRNARANKKSFLLLCNCRGKERRLHIKSYKASSNRLLLLPQSVFKSRDHSVFKPLNISALRLKIASIINASKAHRPSTNLGTDYLQIGRASCRE